MSRFKRVAVWMGGPSSEREVSLRSGAAVARGLRTKGLDVEEVVIGADLSFTMRDDREAVFIALHGHFGEDGGAQSAVRRIGLPHTGSSPGASARAFDKSKSKPVLVAAGIPTPAFELLKRGMAKTLPAPVVVKPVRQGSSVGVQMVRNEADWPAAFETALSYDDDILVEEYIPGRELTVALIEGEAYPIVEILAPDGNFDYAAKYTAGLTRYETPASLDENCTKRCQKYAEATFRALGCSGMGRVDIRLRPDGEIFVLELNNVPGFTETSLLPKAAAVRGLEFPDLCEKILDLAIGP